MKTRFIHALAILACCMLVGISTARAEGDGEGAGPDGKKMREKKPMDEHHRPPQRSLRERLEFVLQNAAELNLTDEQKSKIEELIAKVEKQGEKIKNDPEIQALHQKIQEAREAGDEEALKNLQKEMIELIRKKTGEKDNPQEVIANILTKEQKEKLMELRKSAMEKQRKGDEPRGEGRRGPKAREKGDEPRGEGRRGPKARGEKGNAKGGGAGKPEEEGPPDVTPLF